jgi:hypothetical protein
VDRIILWGLCLSILAALAAIILAVIGGGNDARNFSLATGDERIWPRTLVVYSDPVEHEAMLFQWEAVNRNSVIEATPTPAAIAIPTVTAAASTPALSSPASGLENCPAVIVETFGEHAPAACAVAWCESRFDSHAVGDGGRSLGWFQLWTGWAAWYGVQVDALFDPATNAAVARAVFEHRGRWGGAGGWTCADLLNIP